MIDFECNNKTTTEWDEVEVDEDFGGIEIIDSSAVRKTTYISPDEKARLCAMSLEEVRDELRELCQPKKKARPIPHYRTIEFKHKKKRV